MESPGLLWFLVVAEYHYLLRRSNRCCLADLQPQRLLLNPSSGGDGYDDYWAVSQAHGLPHCCPVLLLHFLYNVVLACSLLVYFHISCTHLQQPDIQLIHVEECQLLPGWISCACQIDAPSFKVPAAPLAARKDEMNLRMCMGARQ